MAIDIATAGFEEVASFLETQTVTGTGAAVFYSSKDANGNFNSHSYKTSFPRKAETRSLQNRF
jgi:hypothetical protein